jgi:hypothetical protein
MLLLPYLNALRPSLYQVELNVIELGTAIKAGWRSESRATASRLKPNTR